MERRKCSRCGHPMTRMLTNDAGRWSACYTCLSCGYEAAAVTAKSETAAKDGLERFMDRVDLAHEAAAGRSATPTKPRPAEADRLLKVYDLYCQLCEALTGKPIAKLDELLTAAKKAKRELEAYKGAGLRYEEEIARARGGKLYAYPIILTEEENGAYSVLIPDFGCATCGKDEIEARLKAAECIVGRMIAMRDDNETFPAPAEMTDALLRESCVSVGTDPGKAFWELSLVQIEEEQ